MWPPSTGSDDFRLLRDSSSKPIAYAASLSHTHTHTQRERERAHQLRQDSGCHLLASLCQVEVWTPAWRTTCCRHLNRYGPHFTGAHGHVCYILSLFYSYVPPSLLGDGLITKLMISYLRSLPVSLGSVFNLFSQVLSQLFLFWETRKKSQKKKSDVFKNRTHTLSHTVHMSILKYCDHDSSLFLNVCLDKIDVDGSKSIMDSHTLLFLYVSIVATYQTYGGDSDLLLKDYLRHISSTMYLFRGRCHYCTMQRN